MNKKLMITCLSLAFLFGTMIPLIRLYIRTDADKLIEGNENIIVQESNIEPTFELRNNIPEEYPVDKLIEDYNLVWNEERQAYEGSTSGKQKYTPDGYWDGTIYDYWVEEPGGDRFYNHVNNQILPVVTIPSTENGVDPLKLRISDWDESDITLEQFRITVLDTYDDSEYINIKLNVENNNYMKVYPFVYGVIINDNQYLELKSSIISNKNSNETFDIKINKKDIHELGIIHVEQLQFKIGLTDNVEYIGENHYNSCLIYSSLGD